MVSTVRYLYSGLSKGVHLSGWPPLLTNVKENELRQYATVCGDFLHRWAAATREMPCLRRVIHQGAP